jgi:hypothetical protein
MPGRIIKVCNSTRVTATIGGKTYHFRCKLEYRWAKYLQFLQDAEQIFDWSYETKEFMFTDFGYTKGPFVYRPDFFVQENDGREVIYECKGHHDSDTNSKFQRMAKHYPNVRMILVLQRIPKRSTKGAMRRFNASRYVERIIDASEIFRQIKGYVNLDPPKIRDI